MLAPTYEVLATAVPCWRRHRRDVHAHRQDELENSLSTTSNELTNVVRITVKNSNPRTAARLANSLANRLKQLAAQMRPERTEVLNEFGSQPELARLLSADSFMIVG